MSEPLEATAAALADHSFLVGLPDGTGTLLAGCARLERFEPGSFLLREGESADTVYLLTTGRVAIEVHAPGKGGVVIDTVGAGHVVGLSWVAPPYTWQFDARAVEPVECVAIDARCLREELEQHPVVAAEFHRRLASTLLDRLQATRIRLLDLYGDVRGN